MSEEQINQQQQEHSGEPEQSRRRMLKGGLAAGGYAAAGGMPFVAGTALAQDEEMVPFTDMPADFTGPPKVAGGIFFQNTTGIDSFFSRVEDQFYVVQHYNQPEIADEDHRLRITGLVDNPVELTMAQLRRRPRKELIAGFECGGNNPNIYHGLVGNARWVGTSLRDLLMEAGLQPEGTEVVFYGADRGMETIRETQVEQSFARSLHRDEALDPDADIMLAWEMNDEPLHRFHGAPLRLVVPGWYGVANVKWLNQIHVQDRRFAGKYMARDYVTLSRRNVGGQMRWEERLVTRIRLKSAITRVTRRGDIHNIMGFVLNDGTPIRSVEVSIDGGPWRLAEVDPNATKYSWKLFSYRWEDANPGEHSIVSRVIDANGEVQPTPEEMPEKISRWENNAQFTRTLTIG